MSVRLQDVQTKRATSKMYLLSQTQILFYDQFTISTVRLENVFNDSSDISLEFSCYTIL